MTPPDTTPDHDLDLLRAFGADPENDAGTAEDARSAARALLLERIAEAPRGQAGTVAAKRARAAAPAARRPRPVRARPWRRRSALALCAVAVTAVAVGIGFGGFGAGTGGNGPVDRSALVSALASVPNASAARPLRAAAAKAVGQPTIPFDRSGVWEVHTLEAELLIGGRNGLSGDASIQSTDTGDDRYAAVVMKDQRSRTTIEGRVNVDVEPIGEPRFTTKGSADAWKASDRPQLMSGGSYPVIFGEEGSERPFEFGREYLSYEELLALPTDTKTLRARITAATRWTDIDGVVQGDNDMRRLTAITELMTRAPLPPELRGALWRVAAELPEVRSLGAMRDPAGRMGEGVTVTHDDDRLEVVFDPSTGMLLSSWSYKISPVTTCDQDMRHCDPRTEKLDAAGQPWRVLAQAGAVQKGTTVLSAEVMPNR